jgi:predicted NBD/HSP70 family sugar kinase
MEINSFREYIRIVTESQARHWRSAADALAVVRRDPGVTRAELGRRLGLDSGPTSDLMKRMVAAGLTTERATIAGGRGRPTTTVHASQSGPVAIVLDVRHGDWRLGICALDGTVDLVASGRHDDRRPYDQLDALREQMSVSAQSLGQRLAGIGVSVPGPTAGNRLVHATMPGWRDVDMSRVVPTPDVPLVVANDATMSAVAEARLHTPRPRSLLHVVVEIGVGGALVVDGRPMPSAHGLQGEIGHLPFGDPAARCWCGARGCWNVAFDLERIAAAVLTEVPLDPRPWLHRLFTEDAPAAEVRRMREALAADLGRGIAGLVNAVDPDVVTLGGLAAELRATSPEGFEQTLLDGLMTVHRERPPVVVAARGGENASLIGLGLTVFDHVLDAEMLARWAGRVPA